MNTLCISTPPSHSVQSPTSILRINDPVMGWRTRPVHDLIMIRGAKGYSWLYWRDGSRQIMAYTLKHYELRLPPDQYLRVHQNCMVNRDLIQKIQLTHKGPLMHLSTGDRIAISRRRWVAIKRILQPLLV